jgi:hypothetical protein
VIIYKLRCANSHEFDGWFKDMKSFDRQRKATLVACPNCGSRNVEKMIASTRTLKGDNESAAPLKKQKHDYRYAMLRKISDKIRESFQDVGERFPEEARKIHYGETKPKNIYGQTSEAEEKALKDEGIEFFKFSMLKPRDD